MPGTGTEPKPRPLRCGWTEEPDGLVPGCMARMHDPDEEACTCPTLADELAKAQEELATLKRHHQGLRDWTDHIVAAVHAHPDGLEIMKNAADRA
ncbi:hypothetical protein ACGFYY_32685 [Streptomyces sp. NPDC048331]|uniref:hypothetical protein n=1 Tax=Streptomyces sp. NPDC048331 TaxID=3365534 RepID=UPI00371BADE5